MPESEYKKLRRHLRFLTVAVVIFILLAIATLVHTFISPSTTSFPKVQVINGKNGLTPQIDYGKINDLIQSQIASLPIPQNGVNGSDGQSITGPSGQTTEGTIGPQGMNGQSIIGPQGDPGSPGKEIELRHNDAKAETEWRYVGDFGWQVLFKDCQITNTCGTQ